MILTKLRKRRRGGLSFPGTRSRRAITRGQLLNVSRATQSKTCASLSALAIATVCFALSLWQHLRPAAKAGMPVHARLAPHVSDFRRLNSEGRSEAGVIDDKHCIKFHRSAQERHKPTPDGLIGDLKMQDFSEDGASPG